MLFKCKFAKYVWREVQLEHIILELASLLSPQDVFMYIWKCTEDLQTKLITTMWVINRERNAVNAGERQKSASQIGAQVQSFYHEFLEFFSKKGNNSCPTERKWKKPSHGYVKLNFDASFREDTNAGGWGFVGRDAMEQL